MKAVIRISVIGLIILSGCQVSMSPSGEIANTSYNIVKQDGKSVWLIYQDSTGINYENENGIHKIKYSTYRCLGKRKLRTEYFDLLGNFLDTGTVLGYGRAEEIWKKDKLIEQSFLDGSNHLIQPYYFNYAKIKQKHYKDGSWRIRYFDCNMNPSCNRGVSEQHVRPDSTWLINGIDTSYLLGIKVLSQKECIQE